MDIQRILQEGRSMFLPNLSIDTVVVGYQDQELKVLLLEADNHWMLPGGYIYREESVEEASKRILQARTGLSRFYLRLLEIFGDHDRSFPDDLSRLLKKLDIPWDEKLWINERFVSITYYALVNVAETKPTGGLLSENFAWHRLSKLPKMLFDHEKIAKSVLGKMRKDISSSQQFANLLPEKFTMPELHQLHEHILDKKIDRSRFQKKMFSLNLFERLEEFREGVPHRKPFLYRVIK